MEKFISERNYVNDLQNVSATRDNHFFKELYKRYWTPLIHYSSQYLDDRATCEEIVQELFIQLHLKRDEIKIRTSLSSYLYTALRNRIFNHFRDQAVYRRHISTASRSAAGYQDNIEQHISLKELQESISGFLPSMPAKYREVYMLRDQDQLTVRRISEVLQRPLNTVEKQLRKANILLREYLIKKQLRLPAAGVRQN